MTPTKKRTLRVQYFDNDHMYIDRVYETDIDLQEALMKLVADITDKEDELETQNERD